MLRSASTAPSAATAVATAMAEKENSAQPSRRSKSVFGAQMAASSSSASELAAVLPPSRSSATDAEVQRALQAEQEALKALDFYRKALEEQVARSKQESTRFATAAAYRSDSQLLAQNKYTSPPVIVCHSLMLAYDV